MVEQGIPPEGLGEIRNWRRQAEGLFYAGDFVSGEAASSAAVDGVLAAPIDSEQRQG